MQLKSDQVCFSLIPPWAADVWLSSRFQSNSARISNTIQHVANPVKCNHCLPNWNAQHRLLQVHHLEISITVLLVAASLCDGDSWGSSRKQTTNQSPCNKLMSAAHSKCALMRQVNLIIAFKSQWSTLLPHYKTTAVPLRDIFTIIALVCYKWGSYKTCGLQFVRAFIF